MRRRPAHRRLQPSAAQAVTLPEVDETDWVADLPASHGIASAAVERVLAAGTRVSGLRALVIVRDGVLVGERYYRGALPSHLLPINSVTKSVTSLLVGLALQRGDLPGLDVPLRELLSEAGSVPDAPLAGVTLRQILQGRTGLSFDIGRSRELLNAPDPVQYALALPRTPRPRTGWSYNDAAIGLLAPVLERVAGADLSSLAARDLFAPLGIRRYAWQRDRRGHALAYAGVALRTRDLAKLAWMTMQQGRWRDTQVVPAQWLADSTRAHGPAAWKVPPLHGIGYGHLWFTGALRERPLVWGLGYGGQFALMSPTQRLVVATAAGSPPREQAMAQMRAIGLLIARVVDAAG